MPNEWISHVKKYQEEHNVSYKQAMKDAKDTYKKKLAKDFLEKSKSKVPVDEVIGLANNKKSKK